MEDAAGDVGDEGESRTTAQQIAYITGSGLDRPVSFLSFLFKFIYLVSSRS
jgi:hypothetical protein